MKKFVWLVVCLVAISADASAAPVPAINFTSFTTYSGDGPWTLGFQFSTNGAIDVSQLGAFDLNQDGFVVNHNVGLWDASGNLLASTTVTSTDPLNGLFRYANISPVLLNAGQNYYVGADGYGGSFDTYALTASDLTTASEINYIHSAFNQGVSLAFPSSSDVNNASGYYGANFTFGSAAVPEPPSLALIGLGLAGIGFLRKKKKTS